MNIGMIFVTSFIGLSFIAWAILSKFLGFHGAWANVVVTLGTGLTALCLSRFYIVTQHLSAPPLKSIIILFCVAMVNGYAVSLYARNVANPEIPAAIFMVMVSVFMVIWAPILDYAFNSATPSIRHIFGYVCAIGAIYLLTK